MELTPQEREMLRSLLDDLAQVTGYERAKTLVGLREKLLGVPEETENEED